MPNAFHERSRFDIVTSHIFPQSVLISHWYGVGLDMEGLELTLGVGETFPLLSGHQDPFWGIV